MPTQRSFVNPSFDLFAARQAATRKRRQRQPEKQQDRHQAQSLQAPAFIAWLDEIAVNAFRRRMLAVEPLDSLTGQSS